MRIVITAAIAAAIGAVALLSAITGTGRPADANSPTRQPTALRVCVSGCPYHWR